MVLDVWRRDAHIFRVAVEQSFRDPVGRTSLESLMARYVDLLAAAVDADRAAGVAVDCPPSEVRRRAEALAWMGARNSYRLFSREHTRAEEEDVSRTVHFLILRGLGCPQGCPQD